MTLFNRDPCSFPDWLPFRCEFSRANSSQSETSLQNYVISVAFFGAKKGACLCGLLSSQASQCCHFKFWYILVCRCLSDSPYADVCFLIHGVPMPAHRVILTARSSYFAHMFMSKWRDRPIIELKHKLVR